MRAAGAPRRIRPALMAKAAGQAAVAATLMLAALIVQGCGTTQHIAATTGIPPALLRHARPIGVSARFHPPPDGPVTGRCQKSLGPRSGVHVEVFAANRVLLVPAGIGTRAPRASSAGRITHAACYGALVTLDPTGLVLVRTGVRLSLAALFRSWGQPLSPTRLASFRAAKGSRVTTYVNGRLWHGTPQTVPLTPHAEIVLELGPHVPPHSSYAFPPGT